jgi:hypothetical protein
MTAKPIGTAPTVRADLFDIKRRDEWLRRRVRMCYWKQWRWPRTKISHLLALGVRLKTATQHGVSSKSYWHMARTAAVQPRPFRIPGWRGARHRATRLKSLHRACQLVEPPTADPHGGWCGGRGRETFGSTASISLASFSISSCARSLPKTLIGQGHCRSVSGYRWTPHRCAP